MISITEKEFRDFVIFRTKLNELILLKVTQMAIIHNGKPPKGIWNDYDFEEKDGRIMIQFESFSCGETDYVTYYLPLEFLFDENYIEKYKLIWQEEVRKKQEDKERNKKQMEEEKKRLIGIFELGEYKRLKLKYG